jgi:hypothetical protein
MSDHGLEVDFSFGEPEVNEQNQVRHHVPGSTRVRNAFYVRTSDRITFKRCRRKWNWQFSHRGNRTPIRRSNPLWLGTGFHFAMEDRHGKRLWPTAADAWQAYHDAWLKSTRAGGSPLPDDHEELSDLTLRMLEYYEEWLTFRVPLNTFVYQGKPQVERRFEIQLPVPPEVLAHYGYDACYYVGTIDRVIVDEHGRLWLVDYKTAKRFETGHFDTDPQISAYCWAAQKIYPDREIAGFIYQQHKKQVPGEPKFLTSSGMFSVSKTQATTYPLYYKALKNLYGDVNKAPAANIEYLNNLAAAEQGDMDAFIRRDYVQRNEAQIASVEEHMVLEAMDMMNPNLPLYPNHTRDCSWDCPFNIACINQDDGGDAQYELESSTVDRAEEDDSWHKHLRLP